VFNILDAPSFPEPNSFIIGPLHAISDILIDSEIDDENFDSVIIKFLIDYFKDIKENRTIDNVSEVLESLYKIYKFPSIRDYKEYQKDMNIRDFGKKWENFLEENIEEIEELSQDPKTGPFMMSWILNLDEAIRILLEFLDKCGSKQKYNKRKHTQKDFEDNLSIFLKAVFLVFFRIVEQMYQIINEIPYDIEKEKQFLIEDIVYLDNIQKSIIYDLQK